MSSPPAQVTNSGFGSRPDPLVRDIPRGSVAVPGAGRVALFSEEFVREFHFAIVDTFPEIAPDILYRCGFEWALRSMVAFTREPEPDRNGAPASTVVLTRWWEGFRQAGWGAVARAEPIRPDMALIELQQGGVGPALGRTDDPVCHLYAGLFAGAFSFITGIECHGVEIECRAAGAESCRFILGPSTEIDCVETRRQQGMPAREILARLGARGEVHQAATDESATAAIVMRDRRGGRVVGGPAEMLRAMRFVLENERSGGWTTILKTAGRRVGRTFAAQQDASLRRTGATPLGEQPPASVVLLLASYFREYGWGVLSTDASGAEEHGLVVSSLCGSPFVELLEDDGSPADALPAGVLQGFFEHVTGQVLACEEIECAATGMAACSFVVSTPERLAMVAPCFGRESAAGIIARLRS